MKTRNTIQAELDQLIQDHYYSEDYELEWAAHQYFETCSPDDQETFTSVLIERLTSDPSISNVTLCKRLPIPELAPVMALLLDRESITSNQSRALLATLERTGGAAAYEAMERFLDSEQQGEALTGLARIDFDRTLPHLRRAIREEDLHNFCIHVLHDHRTRVGPDVFIQDLQKLIEPDPGRLGPHLRKILTSKAGAYNPFSSEDLIQIMEILVL